jgi:plasmid stabilization system protein ParE
MANALQLHPLAYQDAREAVAWYTAISPQLGKRFTTALKTAFAGVKERPQLCAFIRQKRQTRFAKLKKFPYFLMFRWEDEVVHILGVFHSASNPRKWSKRVTDVGP